MTGRGTYSLQLNLRPSFHKASNWVIIDDGDSSELIVEVSHRHGTKGFEIATKIDRASSEKIHGVCEGALKDVGNWKCRGGLDGIVVEGSYESQTLGDLRFSFWSPRMGDQPHELIEAVFESVASVNLGDQWNDYFEQLRSYFEFGAPDRLLEGSPAILRISCGLSADMEEELQGIFAQAAQYPELVIDMRNFDFIGTKLVPVFNSLVAREAPTTWRASEAALKYLAMMGVPEEKIEHQAEI